MLQVFCSLDSENVFAYLADRYNSFYLQDNNSQNSRILVTGVHSEKLGQLVLSHKISVVVPDSSLLLDLWEQEKGPEQDSLIQEFTVFAVSPVIIALHREAARALGFPQKSVRWVDFFEFAQSKSSFRWAHSSRYTGSGISVLAIYELITQGMNSEAAKAIKESQKSIWGYGASDRTVLEGVFSQGKWQIDAVVAQEQTVLQLATEALWEKTVLIFPQDGTLWADYPLTLLSSQDLDEDQFRSYYSFRDYLSSSDAQATLARFGFHPMGPQSLSYLEYIRKPSESIFKSWINRIGLSNRISRRQRSSQEYPGSITASKEIKLSTSTDLVRPELTLLELAKDSWVEYKRRTAVILVCDVSGSMEGEKLEQAKQGLLRFMDLFESEDEQVGLIAFSDQVLTIAPLDTLRVNRHMLERKIIALSPLNKTALIDAVAEAYDEMGKQVHLFPNYIRALIVMTDGLENASSILLEDLVEKLAAEHRHKEVVIYCIAYGRDADRKILEQIAHTTKGDTFEGDIENIGEVYRQLSQRF